MNTKAIIQELRQITEVNIKEVSKFKALNSSQLNWRPKEKAWSILECLEHLNLYGDYYLPEIEHQMNSSKDQGASEYKPGWLGNYFAKMMKHREQLNTMSTLPSKNPIGSSLNESAIDKFLSQQEQTLQLLDKAEHKNLQKIKTGTTLSKWLKLRLGDTLRVVIYHNERHVLQAMRNLVN